MRHIRKERRPSGAARVRLHAASPGRLRARRLPTVKGAVGKSAAGPARSSRSSCPEREPSAERIRAASRRAASARSRGGRGTRRGSERLMGFSRSLPWAREPAPQKSRPRARPTSSDTPRQRCPIAPLRSMLSCPPHATSRSERAAAVERSVLQIPGEPLRTDPCAPRST